MHFLHCHIVLTLSIDPPLRQHMVRKARVGWSAGDGESQGHNFVASTFIGLSASRLPNQMVASTDLFSRCANKHWRPFQESYEHRDNFLQEGLIYRPSGVVFKLVAQLRDRLNFEFNIYKIQISVPFHHSTRFESLLSFPELVENLGEEDIPVSAFANLWATRSTTLVAMTATPQWP